MNPEGNYNKEFQEFRKKRAKDKIRTQIRGSILRVAEETRKSFLAPTDTNSRKLVFKADKKLGSQTLQVNSKEKEQQNPYGYDISINPPKLVCSADKDFFEQWLKTSSQLDD